MSYIFSKETKCAICDNTSIMYYASIKARMGIHVILFYYFLIISTPPFDRGTAIGHNCYYGARPPSLAPEILRQRPFIPIATHPTIFVFSFFIPQHTFIYYIYMCVHIYIYIYTYI